MKVIILAGGFGTRISEESQFKPKPMIEIGGMPIIWHIMKLFSNYGYNDFVICAGYKQEYIKNWFYSYSLLTSDVTFDLSSNQSIIHTKHTEPWRITIVDTGLNTETGGRIKRVQKYIGNERFIVTYGDAVGDVNIKELVDFHLRHGKIGTISAYNFGQNKGVLEINNGKVEAFREKSNLDGDLINIGFMVFEPTFFDLIKNDKTPLEGEPLISLLKKNELMAYVHKGFWQCMDTLREKEKIEKLWCSGKAPWKVWNE
jgi:glucose-1-phosphate cytidylyltransferase